MATVDIDFMKWLRINALDQPDILISKYPNEWLLNKLLVANDMIQVECPDTVSRLQNGYLSERSYAYVACQMVLRVVRWRQFKSETNGSYTYTNVDPQSNPPGTDGSPNLYVSKREKALLNGYGEDSVPMGTMSMGLDRAYGL